MTITDSIAILFSIFLIIRGLNRGFLGSILWPLSLILSSFISYFFYIGTKNIILSLCIGLICPFILKWIFNLSLLSWNVVTNPEKKINLISRVLGAFLTWVWGISMFTIVVLLVAFLRPINDSLKFIHNDVHASKLYALVCPLVLKTIDQETPQNNMKSLADDTRIQNVINDPGIVEALNHKDYASLIRNPKITALVQDPVLIKKMMSLYRQMNQETP